MKKIYYLLLAFALVLPFSCSKPGSDNSGSDEVKMTDPATKEVATVITFPADKTPELVAKKERVRVKKFEFTEASRYIMTFEPATKASDEEVLVGTYTYKDGVYTLSGIGSVKVSGNNVTVTPASGEAQSVTATVVPTKTSTDAQANASRTWKVNTVIVGLVGGNTNVEKKFNGCNLEEISNYAKANGVPFSDEEMNSFKGAVLNEIILTGASTFILSFGNGEDCLTGIYSISYGNVFKYKLDQGNIADNGSIEFPSNSKCKLVIHNKATFKGTEYNGTLEFDLSEKK
ncbi:MAG: hypothetical protein IJQ35_04095 [Bacteroidales bacterium]|nr:hypothetical protein [Bacteroidales bacterium]